MLAAQRQLYRDAKKFNTVLVALSVWIPFALSVIILLIPENKEWKCISYILSIVSMIFSFVIDRCIEEKKQLAAFIQQKFDVYVYTMPWDKRFSGKVKILIMSCNLFKENFEESAGKEQIERLVYSWS